MIEIIKIIEIVKAKIVKFGIVIKFTPLIIQYFNKPQKKLLFQHAK
jgi:hypothetical protein